MNPDNESVSDGPPTLVSLFLHRIKDFYTHCVKTVINRVPRDSIERVRIRARVCVHVCMYYSCNMCVVCCVGVGMYAYYLLDDT